MPEINNPKAKETQENSKGKEKEIPLDHYFSCGGGSGKRFRLFPAHR